MLDYLPTHIGGTGDVEEPQRGASNDINLERKEEKKM